MEPCNKEIRHSISVADIAPQKGMSDGCTDESNAQLAMRTGYKCGICYAPSM